MLDARYLTLAAAILFTSCVPGWADSGTNDRPELPDFSQVRGTIEQVFAGDAQFRRGDLISRRQVELILGELQRLDWEVEDGDEILGDVLPDGASVVTTLRSAKGRKFMRQVSGFKLIYDRLDRISQESGGRQLLQDLVKLPDAARYARYVTGGGVPDLEGFLPKKRDGKTRRVKDYDKPTGRIYTIDQLVKRLKESHDAAREQQQK